MKSIKFDPKLITKILSGEKNITMRLYDEKNFQIGEQVDLINKKTLEKFATAKITSLHQKKISQLTDEDFIGQEKFHSLEQMFQVWRGYYPDKEVSGETVVKIIGFELKK